MQKLLTKQIKKSLPKLYSTEKIPEKEKVAQVKFFNPCGQGTWYGIEYEPNERLFFGYVELFEGEYGYFSLDELESVKLPFGLKIERDIHFTPTTMEKILEE